MVKRVASFEPRVKHGVFLIQLKTTDFLFKYRGFLHIIFFIFSMVSHGIFNFNICELRETFLHKSHIRRRNFPYVNHS